jgi:tetratricopeptide (TPR) repeat protein
LKQRLHPEFSEHDDLELMTLRAEWQTMDWNEILARSLKCLNAVEASATHRVDAGVMALMMLSFRGDRATGEETFRTILSVGERVEADAESMLQALMVFHTNWGSVDEAVRAAHLLVAQHESRQDIGMLFRSLCNASVTFRAAGLFDTAEEHLRRALDLADRHHLHLSKARAVPMLANMSIEIGRIDEARNWLKVLAASPIASDDKLGHAEVSAISARLALLDGRVDDARILVDRDLEHLRIDQVPHRRTYHAALRVAVELGANGIASTATLDELEAAYLLSRSNLFQAFATFALYAGRVSVGEPDRGAVILTEYLQSYRREPWPAPRHLLESLFRTVDLVSLPDIQQIWESQIGSSSGVTLDSPSYS